MVAEHDGVVVAAREGDVLATTFHPELTGDRAVHRYFLEADRWAGSWREGRRGDSCPDTRSGPRPNIARRRRTRSARRSSPSCPRHHRGGQEGGDPSPENNASLAAAIAKAKSYSLPKDKIETAIEKAFGGGDGASTRKWSTRATALRAWRSTSSVPPTTATARPLTSACAFTRAGGNLAATGSVAFQFERKGSGLIDPTRGSAMRTNCSWSSTDAGGEDSRTESEWVVYTAALSVMAGKTPHSRTRVLRSRVPNSSWKPTNTD